MLSYFGRVTEANTVNLKLCDFSEALALWLRVGDFDKVIAGLKSKQSKGWRPDNKTLNGVYRQIGDQDAQVLPQVQARTTGRRRRRRTRCTTFRCWRRL